MRVLALKRQPFGGTSTFSELLAVALDKAGVEFVVDSADDWIPNETGGRTDRETSKRVRAAAQGFDTVCAFGYRSAWACATTFPKNSWTYVAFDMPKTTHPRLVENLNLAHTGVCSSTAVEARLQNAGAKNLQLIHPGLPLDRRLLDRSECRAMLGLEPDAFLIVCAGRFDKDHSLETAIHVNEALPNHCRLLICGRGEEEQNLRAIAGIRCTIDTGHFSQQTALAAADLVVVPSTVSGFSMTAIEAMLQGTPVALRRIGGHTDIVEDYVNGFLFDTDEAQLDLLNHLVWKRELLQETGRAGRHTVLNKFNLTETAYAYKRLFESVLGLSEA